MARAYDLRLTTDEYFLRKIAVDLGMDFNGAAVREIVQEALTLYGHVAQEAAQGRLVVNCNMDGSDVSKIILKNCDHARRVAVSKKKTA